MVSRRFIAAAAVVVFATGSSLLAQSDRHGRKYKAPPPTSHLEVLVVKNFNGKVIENAGVIFHPTKDGIDEGNLEVKSGPDGKAFIDIIPTGSDVQVQVIANGFETYAGDLKLDAPSKQLTIRMKRPKEQVSAYSASEGEKGGLDRKAGVQEPIRNKAVHVTDAKPLPPTAPVIQLPAPPQDKTQEKAADGSSKSSSTSN